MPLLFCLLLLAASVFGQTVQERIAHVEKAVQPAMKAYKVPAVSVAVVNNGQLEWAHAWGVLAVGEAKPATPETLFQAASISKPVASMALLHLVQAGKLSLDEDVNKRLKGWKLPEGTNVTLRRLLSHTAGLTVHGFPGYEAGAPLPTLVQILDGTKPANTDAIRVDTPPGSIWRYSGGGFTIAQLLAIETTGVPFPDFMERTVLGPLGMSRSTYRQPLPEARRPDAAAGHLGSGAMVPGRSHVYPEMAAAGLWTTPSDLARVILALEKPGKVLSAGTTAQMLTAVKNNYGLGIGVKGSGAGQSFSHGGSNAGFQCMLFGYAERGQGAVVMTNSDAGGRLAEEVLRAISAEYGWPDYKPSEKK
ncbi:MAG: serine hydrolase domain-containing protein [Bryobacteraceae bacterium]